MCKELGGWAVPSLWHFPLTLWWRNRACHSAISAYLPHPLLGSVLLLSGFPKAIGGKRAEDRPHLYFMCPHQNNTCTLTGILLSVRLRFNTSRRKTGGLHFSEWFPNSHNQEMLENFTVGFREWTGFPEQNWPACFLNGHQVGEGLLHFFPYFSATITGHSFSSC